MSSGTSCTNSWRRDGPSPARATKSRRRRIQRGRSARVRYFTLDVAEDLGGRAYRDLASELPSETLVGEWMFAKAAFPEHAFPPAHEYVTEVHGDPERTASRPKRAAGGSRRPVGGHEAVAAMVVAVRRKAQGIGQHNRFSRRDGGGRNGGGRRGHWRGARAQKQARCQSQRP